MSNNPTITVAFHGGGGSTSHTNLHSYPNDTKILSTGPSDPSLSTAELRGFVLGATKSDATDLYVLNSEKSKSEILRYEAKGDGTYHNGKVWATEHLHHPFDAVWGPGGNLYVSNQDPSHDNQIHITVYNSSGKFVGDFAKGFAVLRGITWVGKTLWVADEKGGPNKTGAVIAYACDSKFSGTPTGDSIAVTDPVHVLYDGSRYLYIGSESGNCVYLYDTTQPITQTLAVVASSSASANINKTSGIAIANVGGVSYLYVGSREGQAVNQYILNTSVSPPTTSNPKVVLSKLGDDVEFVGVLGNSVFN
jgi:hypothetical protein